MAIKEMRMDIHLDSIRGSMIPILKSRGVKRAAIFGSFARGEQKKKSDVDLLVQFKKRISLLDLVGLKMDLEEKLNREVDVVEFGAVDKRFKKSIFEDKVEIL